MKRNGTLKARNLRKAYARCPHCKRILKVRVSKTHWGISHRGRWEIVDQPEHKFYNPQKDKLKKLIRTGKAPNEHPWCPIGTKWKFRYQLYIPKKKESIETPVTSTTRNYYKDYWEFIDWR